MLAVDSTWPPTRTCVAVYTLRTSHRTAAVVAEVAIAVADGDGAAVVAGWGVGLEVGELFAAGGRRSAVFEHHAGTAEELEVQLRVAVGVAVRVAIRGCWLSAVGRRLDGRRHCAAIIAKLFGLGFG